MQIHVSTFKNNAFGCQITINPDGFGVPVGEALRRLVAKTLCEPSKKDAREYLWPLQVGCGSPLGAEIAIHTLRQWCSRNADTGKVLLKIDFPMRSTASAARPLSTRSASTSPDSLAGLSGATPFAPT